MKIENKKILHTDILIIGGGNIALYTDEDGVDEMSYYMELFENENFDLHLFREQAKNYIKRFSWENTALQYVELYKSLL